MPDTKRLTELDFAHVWHPFTPMRQWRKQPPVIIERAEGFELIDTEGNRYIDGFSSLWCNVHGHRAPEIDHAVRDQLDRVAHTTMLGHASVPAIEFAGRLVEAANRPNAPGESLNKVFYSDAGAIATEVAFKMAIGHHHHRGEAQRDAFVALSGAYHGDTIGAMSVGFVRVFHEPFESMTFGCVRAPAPDVCRVDAPSEGHTRAGRPDWPSLDRARRERVRDFALDALDEAIEGLGDRCAGVVLEPIMQGAAGMVEQPEGYLSGVAERVRRRGLILIADEVAVGFGRTGTLFACEQENVRPDILCLAKGISGGYLPLAATLCTDEIAASFEGEPDEHRTLYHGHTYTGNPLACAAAIASLDLIERNDVLANVERLSGRMRERLREGLSDHPNVGDVRIRGVMAGIELVAERSPWTPLAPSSGLPQALCAAARPRGALIRPLGDVIILNPAPAMDVSTLDRLLDATIETINSFDFEPTRRYAEAHARG